MIATIGRKTLTDTLDSIRLQKDDELIVVADTACDMDAVSAICAPFQISRSFGVRSNAEGNGYAQRDFGMHVPRHTTHIAFMDDDDIYTEGAFDAIREYADPELPTIFKMMYGSRTYAHEPGDTLWNGELLEYGNVGTPMFVIPNVWSKFGRWKAHTEHDGIPCGGDFTFISETVEKFGGVKWQDHVVALIRPKGRQSEEKSSTS